MFIASGVMQHAKVTLRSLEKTSFIRSSNINIRKLAAKEHREWDRRAMDEILLSVLEKNQ